MLAEPVADVALARKGGDCRAGELLLLLLPPPTTPAAPAEAATLLLPEAAAAEPPVAAATAAAPEPRLLNNLNPEPSTGPALDKRRC